MPKRFLVECLETGVVYNSITEACNATGADNKTLRGAIEKAHYTAKGFHWQKLPMEKVKKSNKLAPRKHGKKCGTFTGIYPPDEQGYEDIGNFYHDKYKAFLKPSGENYFYLKVCLIPPLRERKANFILGVDMKGNRPRICRTHNAAMLNQHYKFVYNALERFIEEKL
jgi:hypothetical protein